MPRRSHTGEEGPPAKKPRYAIWEDGISFKRALIDRAKELSAKGDIKYKGALRLWSHACDGTGVTKTEQRTLEKILREYRFCPDAEELLKKNLQTLSDSSDEGSGGPVAIARDLQASATPVRNGGMLSILSWPFSGLWKAASGVLKPLLDKESRGNNAAASSERASSVQGLPALVGVPGAIASSSVPGSAADGVQALPGVPTRPLIASSSVPGSAAYGAGLQALPRLPTRPLIASSSVPGSAAYGAGLQALPGLPTRPLAAAFSVPGSAADGPGSDPLSGLGPELRTLLAEQEPDGGPLAKLQAGPLRDNAQRVTFDQTCPKRQGTAAANRYNRYKRARTVGEALELGAWKGDIANDSEKGYLRFHSAAGSAPSAPAGSLAAALGVAPAAPPPEAAQASHAPVATPAATGDVEQPSQPVTDDTARQRAQVDAEVDRILSTRSAEEILGSAGTTRDAMQGEFRRMLLILHADKGIVSSEDQRASLALRLVLAAKKKLL